MEKIKAIAVKHVNEFVDNPASKAMDLVGSLFITSLGFWFAALVINFAARIMMDSYAIITSAF